jgi:thiosulfate reductase cytochrome b subunit
MGLFNQASRQGTGPSPSGHAAWVRLAHWLLAASVLTLAFSGVVILMAHPRLYWGDAGNDLTKALIELPISPNWRHDGWGPATTFFTGPHGPVMTRIRTYDPFNDNAWARSLHFLMAWLFVATLTAYAVMGLITGHLRRDLVPHGAELAPRMIWRDVQEHLSLKIRPTVGGPPYNVLQKAAYAGVIIVALPMMILTGLSMSPAFGAAWHWLPALFGGSQSARTLHFVFLCLLLLFVAVHLVMVALSGPVRQLRAMTFGR